MTYLNQRLLPIERKILREAERRFEKEHQVRRFKRKHQEKRPECVQKFIDACGKRICA